jgi:ABC-type transport system involved in multi-copper enzyme maturation permease subunit
LNQDTRLWLRQIAGVLRLELRRALFSGRAAPIYLLAALPVFASTLVLLVSLFEGGPDEMDQPQSAAMIYAVLYQFSLVVVYLGCVWIFMNLFRGEILDRSLHFYFLCPIRRDVLVVGKYVAGWISAVLVFASSTVLSLAVFYSAFGPAAAADYLLSGHGLAQWPAYLGITALACLGYGAVFLVVGLFFRNPLIPAVVIFFIEGLNPVLPSLLKKVSVIFYLQSLLPVTLDEGPFALMADPVPAWISVPGLLLFTGATLFAATLRIRRMEIAYGVD